LRAIIQRVHSGSVTIKNQPVRSIGKGLVILLGISSSDGEKEADWIIQKILNLRIFPNPERTASEFDLSILEIKGEILLVSQFTLYANLAKGRRPDFAQAAPPDVALTQYNHFVEKMESSYPKVVTGEFGAQMLVEIHNQGPVTLVLESPSNP